MSPIGKSAFQFGRVSGTYVPDCVQINGMTQSLISVTHKIPSSLRNIGYDFDALDAHAPRATGDFVVPIDVTGGTSVF